MALLYTATWVNEDNHDNKGEYWLDRRVKVAFSLYPNHAGGSFSLSSLYDNPESITQLYPIFLLSIPSLVQASLVICTGISLYSHPHE